MPLHALADGHVERGAVDPIVAFGKPGLRQSVRADAQQPVPDKFGDPAVGAAADVERVYRYNVVGRIEQDVLLVTEGRDARKGPEVLDADARLVDDGFLVPHVPCCRRR